MWSFPGPGTLCFRGIFPVWCFFLEPNPYIVLQKQMVPSCTPPKKKHSPQNLMEWKIPTEKRIKKLKHPPKLLLRFLFGRKKTREKPSHCRIPPIAILFLMRGPLLERPGISSVCGRWWSSKRHMGRWHVTVGWNGLLILQEMKGDIHPHPSLLSISVDHCCVRVTQSTTPWLESGTKQSHLSLTDKTELQLFSPHVPLGGFQNRHPKNLRVSAHLPSPAAACWWIPWNPSCLDSLPEGMSKPSPFCPTKIMGTLLHIYEKPRVLCVCARVFFEGSLMIYILMVYGRHRTLFNPIHIYTFSLL